MGILGLLEPATLGDAAGRCQACNHAFTFLQGATARRISSSHRACSKLGSQWVPDYIVFPRIIPGNSQGRRYRSAPAFNKAPAPKQQLAKPLNPKPSTRNPKPLPQSHKPLPQTPKPLFCLEETPQVPLLCVPRRAVAPFQAGAGP